MDPFTSTVGFGAVITGRSAVPAKELESSKDPAVVVVRVARFMVNVELTEEMLEVAEMLEEEVVLVEYVVLVLVVVLLVAELIVELLVVVEVMVMLELVMV
jgi:hypothetical protein